MKSRSVFVTAFLWWLVGAAIIGATYPLLILGIDWLFDTGTSDMLDPAIWRATLTGSVFGMIYGVVPALGNAALSSALKQRPWPLERLTQLVAGLWTIVATWLIPETSSLVLERSAITLALTVIAWAIAPNIFARYRALLAPVAADAEARATFVPTQMYTSTADNDEVASFVRRSLRTFGRGNAVFTVAASAIGESGPKTQIFVDSGGTGHALNIGGTRWADKFITETERLADFTLTPDRTLAIAPPGLSAGAVVSQGVSLVQRVSGKPDVLIQFDGFGH